MRLFGVEWSEEEGFLESEDDFSWKCEYLFSWFFPNWRLGISFCFFYVDFCFALIFARGLVDFPTVNLEAKRTFGCFDAYHLLEPFLQASLYKYVERSSVLTSSVALLEKGRLAVFSRKWSFRATAFSRLVLCLTAVFTVGSLFVSWLFGMKEWRCLPVWFKSPVHETFSGSRMSLRYDFLLAYEMSESLGFGVAIRCVPSCGMTGSVEYVHIEYFGKPDDGWCSFFWFLYVGFVSLLMIYWIKIWGADWHFKSVCSGSLPLLVIIYTTVTVWLDLKSRSTAF